MRQNPCKPLITIRVVTRSAKKKVLVKVDEIYDFNHRFSIMTGRGIDRKKLMMCWK